MSAATQLTFDISSPGPRRPTLDDCGGGTLTDDPTYPPDKTTMPYAAQLNQLQFLAAATGRVMPVGMIWVRIISGAPTIYASSLATTNSVTLTPVDEGAGVTRIDWPANSFPSPLGEPIVTPTYTTAANNPVLQATIAPQSELTTNGCRVRTYDRTGTLVDYNFVVALY